MRAALLQMTSGEDVGENTRAVAGAMARAAGEGADILITPEMTAIVDGRPKALIPKTHRMDDDPTLADLREKAAELGIWLLVGSLALRMAGERLANRSVLISADGEIAATYDKIHMFDVDLDGGESYRESKLYRPGSRAVVAGTPWGKVGLSICYDLRFAALYRALAQGGADILTVPSAFTRQTGKAHWHVLLRARAIETGCYVLAPAQTGTHADGRKTFGHTLAVDPWGEVLADGGEAPGLTVVDLDLEKVKAARARIPALAHDRSFEGPVV